MKTTIADHPGDTRNWVVVDAADKALGRIAVKIADALRGKDKPTFTPHVDTGAFVVVVNAEKVALSGRKEEQKIYQRYTGHRGGLKEMTAEVVRAKHPDWLIRLAVRGMLPTNTQGRRQLRRLKVYTGDSHPHAAQNPSSVEFA
jgi:large subunit ribosomal protein L13